MRIVQLTPTIAVSEQISVADVAAIADAGYKVLVNNRPDGEEANQPASGHIGAAAEAAGLEYHYLPITMASFPGPDVARMAPLLDDPERPVLAFCRSGTRCANLWVASRPEAERQQAAQTARQHGYDLGMAARCM
jgi:uncharacterized protein (TIGR01244 family)